MDNFLQEDEEDNKWKLQAESYRKINVDLTTKCQDYKIRWGQAEETVAELRTELLTVNEQNVKLKAVLEKFYWFGYQFTDQYTNLMEDFHRNEPQIQLSFSDPNNPKEMYMGNRPDKPPRNYQRMDATFLKTIAEGSTLAEESLLRNSGNMQTSTPFVRPVRQITSTIVSQEEENSLTRQMLEKENLPPPMESPIAAPGPSGVRPKLSHPFPLPKRTSELNLGSLSDDDSPEIKRKPASEYKKAMPRRASDDENLPAVKKPDYDSNRSRLLPRRTSELNLLPLSDDDDSYEEKGKSGGVSQSMMSNQNESQMSQATTSQSNVVQKLSYPMRTKDLAKLLSNLDDDDTPEEIKIAQESQVTPMDTQEILDDEQSGAISKTVVKQSEGFKVYCDGDESQEFKGFETDSQIMHDKSDFPQVSQADPSESQIDSEYFPDSRDSQSTGKIPKLSIVYTTDQLDNSEYYYKPTNDQQKTMSDEGESTLNESHHVNRPAMSAEEFAHVLKASTNSNEMKECQVKLKRLTPSKYLSNSITNIEDKKVDKPSKDGKILFKRDEIMIVEELTVEDTRNIERTPKGKGSSRGDENDSMTKARVMLNPETRVYYVKPDNGPHKTPSGNDIVDRVTITPQTPPKSPVINRSKCKEIIGLAGIRRVSLDWKSPATPADVAAKQLHERARQKMRLFWDLPNESDENDNKTKTASTQSTSKDVSPERDDNESQQNDEQLKKPKGRAKQLALLNEYTEAKKRFAPEPAADDHGTTRSKRQKTKQVSYKEPALKTKLRRPKEL